MSDSIYVAARMAGGEISLNTSSAGSRFSAAPASEELIRQLAAAKCSLPFRGRGGGTAKTGGCCPRCGSPNYAYPCAGRWKYCFSCGYDRFQEVRFTLFRSLAKKGRWHTITRANLEDVLAYHAKVYGTRTHSAVRHVPR